MRFAFIADRIEVEDIIVTDIVLPIITSSSMWPLLLSQTHTIHDVTVAQL